MKRMDKVQRSQAFLRKRKMLVILPLLVIPFLTMAFWALGGGKKDESQANKVQGLNLSLPNASLKEDKPSDKLSFYDKADKDSIKLEELMQNDPYYKRKKMEFEVPGDLDQITEQSAAKYKQVINTSPYQKSQNGTEDQIMQKVALLQRELNKSQNADSDTEKLNTEHSNQESPEFSNDVNRLENMMQMMSDTDPDDPEMKRMDGMLDKILDIQHPDRVKDRVKEKSLKNKEMVFAVTKQPDSRSVSLLDTSKRKDSEANFFGVESETISKDQNAIEAVIHENQKLVNGSVVKLCLLNDVYISGILIPKESFVFGICSLNGERLQIEINSVRNGNSLFPVKLQVFDMDGLPGIYIPGAITRDVAKQSADNSLQLTELSTMDPSLKAQVAASGLNAAKSLLSKKAKLIRVSVKGGYKVLLRDRKAE
jgi:conjugative transposon TraM protein